MGQLFAASTAIAGYCWRKGAIKRKAQKNPVLLPSLTSQLAVCL